MRKFLSLGAFLIVIALFFWSSVRLQTAFFGAADFFKTYVEANKMAAYFIFTGLSALAAVFAPLSSVPLIPFAVLYWSNTLTQGLLLLGWLIGGALTYFIGYFLGTPIVRHLIDMEKIKKIRGHISRQSEFAFILLFRLAMPAEIPGYALGMIRYPFWTYFLATLIAEIPMAALSVYLGESIVHKNIFLFFNLIFVLALLFFISFYFFIKKRHKMKRNFL